MTFEKTLVSLVENRRWASVKDVLKTMNPADAAAVLDRLEPEVLPILFRLLPKDTAGDCFAEMEPETQEAVLRGLADGELRQIMEELYTDDAAALVEEMPPAVVERILSAAGPEKRRLINQILQYPEDSAGSIMTTEFVRLTPSMTVEQAIGHIRETGLTRETINTCYVTDPQGVLVGILSIRMLIVSDGTTQVSALMEPRDDLRGDPGGPGDGGQHAGPVQLCGPAGGGRRKAPGGHRHGGRRHGRAGGGDHGGYGQNGRHYPH